MNTHNPTAMVVPPTSGVAAAILAVVVLVVSTGAGEECARGGVSCFGVGLSRNEIWSLTLRMEAVELDRGVRLILLALAAAVSKAVLGMGLKGACGCAWLASSPPLVLVLLMEEEEAWAGLVGDPAGIVIVAVGFNGVAAESLSLFSLPGAVSSYYA